MVEAFLCRIFVLVSKTFVEDPKIVATRERKARAAAKKRERKRQYGDGGEGSRPKTKRKKTVSRKDGLAVSGATSSPKPLQTINLTNLSLTVVETAESREDRSPHVSPHGSGNRYVHNYSDTHVNEETDTLRLGNFDDQCGRAMTNVNTKVVQPSLMHRPAHHSLTATRSASPPRSLQRGALAQTDILERFERLQADFDQLAETHSECGETIGKLVQARLDLAHSSHLYTTLSDRYKAVKSEHEGCIRQLEVLEGRNSELSQVNKDQALRIKELEDELARKDSALVYAERLNTKRAQEREKLSHEYKQSLSKPFNLAIQAGWGKGLSEEHSKEDLLELMSKTENFDVYADKKMCVEYDRLFENDILMWRRFLTVFVNFSLICSRLAP
nr:hypothetical protein [Tanacetum cinerariifolium]